MVMWWKLGMMPQSEVAEEIKYTKVPIPFVACYCYIYSFKARLKNENLKAE